MVPATDVVHLAVVRQEVRQIDVHVFFGVYIQIVLVYVFTHVYSVLRVQPEADFAELLDNNRDLLRPLVGKHALLNLIQK